MKSNDVGMIAIFFLVIFAGMCFILWISGCGDIGINIHGGYTFSSDMTGAWAPILGLGITFIVVGGFGLFVGWSDGEDLLSDPGPWLIKLLLFGVILCVVACLCFLFFR